MNICIYVYTYICLNEQHAPPIHIYNFIYIYTTIRYLYVHIHAHIVGGMKSRPFVYYVFPYPNNLDSGSLEGADFTWAVCVKTCPTPRLLFAASIPIPPNR